MNDLFAPPVGQWQRVSDRLCDMRRVVITAASAIVIVAAATPLLIWTDLWWLALLVAVAVAALATSGWVWARRNQRSWGYAENDDDFIVTRGVMFKRLVAVPYGRMQFVDVSAGPLSRAFGIAVVTLHTASTETAATIPGLSGPEAIRLRNRLTELGEARGAGL